LEREKITNIFEIKLGGLLTIPENFKGSSVDAKELKATLERRR
jgi:hypothetical protein